MSVPKAQAGFFGYLFIRYFAVNALRRAALLRDWIWAMDLSEAGSNCTVPSLCPFRPVTLFPEPELNKFFLIFPQFPSEKEIVKIL